VAEFQNQAVCRAPARELWKLLYDPVRFAQWWPGWERVEVGDGATLTRYDARWPDFAYPTVVTTDRVSGRIVVSCMLSDIVHTWALAPTADGCVVSVMVSVPDAEAARMDDVREMVRQALAALVSWAERAVR
jgi:Polyketide cyclase / dehydrase and lipid transport